MIKSSGMAVSSKNIINDITFSTISNKIVAFVLMLSFVFLKGLAQSNAFVYKSDNFGYIVLNGKTHTADIYKYIDDTKSNVECIASCEILKEKKDYMIISTKVNYWKILPNIEVRICRGSDTDSLNIALFVPAKLNDKYFITYTKGKGNTYATKYLNSEGVTKLKIGKDVPLNYITLYIYKDINPFQLHSSFGDSKTISYLPIFPVKHVDLVDDYDDISSIYIGLQNFEDSILKKWIINESYILKMRNKLFWNGYEFFIEK